VPGGGSHKLLPIALGLYPTPKDKTMPPTGLAQQPLKSTQPRWFALAAALLLACALPSATAQGPFLPKHIYSETANPTADINAALAHAKREHKRVLIDFGGDWCGDCQVLDLYFHQSPNAELLDKHFVLVHVWIGQMDANLDVTRKYGVPINKGVPALAVLAPDGKVIYAQNGEFEGMRHMQPSSVTDFLNKWKS
jgi:thiol:disulfide interchange protein